MNVASKPLAARCTSKKRSFLVARETRSLARPLKKRGSMAHAPQEAMTGREIDQDSSHLYVASIMSVISPVDIIFKYI